MKRELRLVDCFGIAVNGIIGSGIFLLPATLFRRAGGLSPLAWLAVGALCALVALCFAEAAGRTDKSGGPYRYASDAFGPHVGFAVGWVTLASSLLGYAAVSRGFAEHASWLLGHAGSRVVEGSLVVVLVASLGVINVLGIKPGARTSDGVGVVKVGALLLFVAVGLLHVRGAAFSAGPAPAAGEAPGVAAAAFAGLFACTGFEYVPVPAGEAKDPTRAIGLAIVLSVIGTTVLYALVQVVAVGTTADLAASKTPLVDAARALAGRGGADAMAWIALVSAFGFCSSSALVSPRYVESFAQDGFLPRLLERRGPRFDAPIPAIVATSTLVIALGATLDFTSLADTSNVAVVLQYISTCASILVMRRRFPEKPSRFRLPLGPLVPVLAIVGSAAFLAQVARNELAMSAALLGGGLVVGLVTRRMRRAA